MQVFCTKCSRELEVPNTALHKRVRCTLCGQVFVANLPQAEVLDDDEGDVEILGPAEPGLPAAPPPLPAVVGPAQEEILEPELVDEPPPPTFALEYERPRVKRSDALANLAERSKFVPKPKLKPGWCFLDAEGKKIGPLDGKGIVEAIKDGRVTPETVLVNNRSGKELQAGKVPGLFKSGKKAGPLSPLKRPPREAVTGSGEVVDLAPRRGQSARFVETEAQSQTAPAAKAPGDKSTPPRQDEQPAEVADDALAALARAAKNQIEADQTEGESH